MSSEKPTPCKVCGGRVPREHWKAGQWIRLLPEWEQGLGGHMMVGRLRRCPRNTHNGLVQWFTGPWAEARVFRGKIGFTGIRLDQTQVATTVDIETARKSCRSCAGTGEQAVAVFLQHVEAG